MKIKVIFNETGVPSGSCVIDSDYTDLSVEIIHSHDLIEVGHSDLFEKLSQN